MYSTKLPRCWYMSVCVWKTRIRSTQNAYFETFGELRDHIAIYYFMIPERYFKDTWKPFAKIVKLFAVKKLWWKLYQFRFWVPSAYFDAFSFEQEKEGEEKKMEFKIFIIWYLLIIWSFSTKALPFFSTDFRME